MPVRPAWRVHLLAVRSGSGARRAHDEEIPRGLLAARSKDSLGSTRDRLAKSAPASCSVNRPFRSRYRTIPLAVNGGGPRACTHKIAISNDLIKSALAHYADSSRISPEVREVPKAAVSRCSK